MIDVVVLLLVPIICVQVRYVGALEPFGPSLTNCS
jgi:hypothetical protein